MHYKVLGKSGLRVSELCLGTMTFGEEWGWGSSKDESRKVFDAYAENGGNFLDTANNYTNGVSESYLGEFITGQREKYVLSSKYTLNTNPKDPNACGNHRKNMIQALDASLKRLKTDYIDLYHLHVWDYTTSIEEVMRGFEDMARAGKILYCGISDTPAWIVSRGQTIAEIRGWAPFAAVQLEYNLLERTIEAEFLPMADKLDIAITAWSPLAMGFLSGKYLNKSDSNARAVKEPVFAQKYQNLFCQQIVQEVVNIANEIRRTPSQVALCWLRQRPNAVVIPIIGARTVEQLKENMGCCDFELTWDQMSRLDEISKIQLGFPYEFLNSDRIKNIIYGETYGLIETH